MSMRTSLGAKITIAHLGGSNDSFAVVDYYGQNFFNKNSFLLLTYNIIYTDYDCVQHLKRGVCNQLKCIEQQGKRHNRG